MHKFRVLYSGMIISFLCITYGDRHNVGVADHVKGKLVAESMSSILNLSSIVCMAESIKCFVM